MTVGELLNALARVDTKTKIQVIWDFENLVD